MIIGCDFPSSWQQVSWLDTETGDCGEQRLVHAKRQRQTVLSTTGGAGVDWHGGHGHSQWFIELVEDVGHEIWIGDAAQIRGSYVRKQKTDDAAHILKLVSAWLHSLWAVSVGSMVRTA
jgi:transposase